LRGAQGNFRDRPAPNRHPFVGTSWKGSHPPRERSFDTFGDNPATPVFSVA
jgi:hypothetical protein